MKLIIFFVGITFVSSELHTFITTYTGVRRANTPETPEFSAVTLLDGQQIDYYDSNEQKLIAKQDWKNEIESKTHWEIHTVIKDEVQQIYRNNILSLMHRFRQSGGVQVFQGKFGCEWEDQTGVHHAFDQYGYDGQDFSTLDLMKGKYIASVPQAENTVMMWNNYEAQLKTLQDYYKNGCFYWLWKFLMLTETAFQSKEPKVSLLLKKADLVDCHVTDFYSNNTVILWKNNGKIVSNSEFVRFGDTLPNEDGTFQKTVTLSVPPEDWKRNQYSCVVTHMGKTTRKILTENEIYGPLIGPLACLEIFAGLFFLYVLFRKTRVHEKVKKIMEVITSAMVNL